MAARIESHFMLCVHFQEIYGQSFLYLVLLPQNEEGMLQQSDFYSDLCMRPNKV